jgi:hypothetical protein
MEMNVEYISGEAGYFEKGVAEYPHQIDGI